VSAEILIYQKKWLSKPKEEVLLMGETTPFGGITTQGREIIDPPNQGRVNPIQ
jgi:hypothetical protein